MIEIYRQNKLYKVVVRHHYIDFKESSKVEVLYVSRNFWKTAKVMHKKHEEYTEKYGNCSGIKVIRGVISELTYRRFNNEYYFTVNLETE